jgi:hypothetical protein
MVQGRQAFSKGGIALLSLFQKKGVKKLILKEGERGY